MDNRNRSVKHGRKVRLQVFPGPSRIQRSDNETLKQYLKKIVSYLELDLNIPEELQDFGLPEDIQVSNGNVRTTIASIAKALGGDFLVESGDALNILKEPIKNEEEDDPLAGLEEGREWDERFKIKFDIERKSTSPPDSGRFSIWNLNPESISYLRDGPKVVRFLAGYHDPKVLFQGDIEKVEEEKQGADREIKITAGDGYRAYSNQTTIISNKTGANARELIRKAGNDMGLAVTIDDNVQDVFMPGGTYLSASSRVIMDDLASTLEADWYIFNNDEIFVTTKQRSIDNVEPQDTFLVSRETGMVASPKKTEKGIEVTSLLEPEIRPHKVFEVETRRNNIGGWYQAFQVRDFGDTREKKFYTTIQGKEI